MASWLQKIFGSGPQWIEPVLPDPGPGPIGAGIKLKQLASPRPKAPKEIVPNAAQQAKIALSNAEAALAEARAKMAAANAAVAAARTSLAIANLAPANSPQAIQDATRALASAQAAFDAAQRDVTRTAETAARLAHIAGEPQLGASVIENAGVNETVVNDDDRVDVKNAKEKPYCAVCYLICEFPNGKFAGTGWMIDATTVVTAGHNLWNPPADPQEPDRAVGQVISITVMPAHTMSNGDPFGAVKTSHYAYDKRWENQDIPDRRLYDYGVILLKKPGFKLPFYFTAYAQAAEDWNSKQVLNCAGYPVDLGNGRFITAAGNACSEQQGGSLFKGPNKEMVIHNIDTEGGESGGPIFWTDGKACYVLAIHTQGKGFADGLNAGVRITPKMVKTFAFWSANADNVRGAQTIT